MEVLVNSNQLTRITAPVGDEEVIVRHLVNGIEYIDKMLIVDILNAPNLAIGLFTDTVTTVQGQQALNLNHGVSYAFGSPTPRFVAVYRNGSRLSPSAYTTMPTDDHVNLVSPADAGDEFVIDYYGEL